METLASKGAVLLGLVHMDVPHLNCTVDVVVEPFSFFFRLLIGQACPYALEFYRHILLWCALDVVFYGLHMWLDEDKITLKYQ